MFDHVTIRVSDPDASDRFYTTVLAVLGLEPSRNELGTEWGDFSMATDGGPVTRNLRIAFFAATPTLVDAFGVLLDPDGNRVEAVHDTRTDASTCDIARLWLRTNDIAAARRFYEAIGVSAALTFVDERPPTEHVHFAFPAATNDVVDAFHKAAVDAGYESNGAPGERAVYHPGYYGAFVLDPDGHNVEVVNHNR